ncbi:glycosyltransferase [Stenotrophomonas sp.]|uniref:glycosyltransferase n=1 Tax=Stenotrophomonas sp. TaxID=69392 RepID=UPI0028ADD2D0|nr:glycosyltransferase [Stenotrophomonas sp.]
MSIRKIRVGVSGHDLKFWYPLQAVLEATGNFEFREDLWSGHDTHDVKNSEALIEWADVLIAEWALGNAVYYSVNKLPSQKLYIRLHAQERRTTYPERIDYSGVDAIVFVGKHILEECVARFSVPREKCIVIGNMIDGARYRLGKFGGAEFVLGMIGISPQSKRLDIALDTLEILLQEDERYTLRIKGHNPASISWLWARAAEREYYESVFNRINSGSLRYKVIFDPPGADVPSWLKMVGTILSPSDHESFHMAVAEGASSGALPIVWSWPGSVEVYPEFPRVDSPRQAADLIKFYNRSAAGPRLRAHAGKFVEARYGNEVISSEWNSLLQSEAAGASNAEQDRRGKSVVVVWAIDNWLSFHRREMLEALAGHMSETHDFLIVEPGNHYSTVASLGWATPEELSRIVSGELPLEAGNIWRTRLFTGGIPSGVQSASYQGRSDQLEVLDGLIKARYDASASVLHWVYKPDQALRLFRTSKFVYEVYDDYTIDFGSGEFSSSVAEMEHTALERAAYVFFTSQPLLERKGGIAKACSLVDNGVAVDVFKRYHVESTVRDGRPVAGYLGNLSVFFDWELMVAVCEALPEVDFVFHGQVELSPGDHRRGLYERLRAMPNVLFSGRVGRLRGAAAISSYDVLLIPFVVNDAMHAVNPLKLWEYFSTGLPVVSTPMDAIKERTSLLRVANGQAEWVSAIRGALLETDVELSKSRVERGEERAWTRLTEEHAKIISSL